MDTAKIGAAKKATVTLINKIGGRDTAFTVTPVFLAPTVTYANGNVPTQNTMGGSTIQLYQVAGSKVNVKAAGLGGTYIKEQTGVTVTGGNNYNDENTYTVTWSSGSTGSFVIVNKPDESKNVTISVNAPSAAITATANMNLRLFCLLRLCSHPLIVSFLPVSTEWGKIRAPCRIIRPG